MPSQDTSLAADFEQHQRTKAKGKQSWRVCTSHQLGRQSKGIGSLKSQVVDIVRKRDAR
jgi:hypothetical protein